MQQQRMDEYDLLAVFNAESDADAAAAKLQKEGFGENEVFRMAPGTVGAGEFREHGPNRDRRDYFLQTSRTGSNPVVAVLLAVIFGVALGGIAFGAADFAIHTISPVIATIVGVVVGVILGAILGLTRRGRERGNIGQRATTNQVSAASKPLQDARTVIAIRLPDPDNITRKSKARAILINNKGKIDRSVGRES